MKKSFAILASFLVVFFIYAKENNWQRIESSKFNHKSTSVFQPDNGTNQIQHPITNGNDASTNEESPGVNIYAYSQNADDYTLNGPVKFNSANPSDMTRIRIVEDEITAGAFGSDAYYVMCTYQYFYPGGLYTVDLQTGELTLVASYIQNYDVRLAVDMSYDYTTETMYMIYQSDNDSYLTALGTVDLKTGEQTFINPEMDRYVRAIAIDKDGTLYGIDESGYLITIDKQTGECAELFDLECIPFYRQSMDFDRSTGVLYWAYSDTYSYGTLKKIDVNTGVVSTIGEIGNDGDEKVLGLHIPYIQCDPAAPAKIENLTINANPNGELNSTITWSCPSTTAEGNTLNNIDKITIYRNNEIIATLTDAAPGKQMTYLDNVASSGTYSYKVVACNDKGEGIFANASTYIGHDLPAAVRITSVTRDNQNTITISWEPPTKGINNGYLDTSSIKYKIIRISDNKTLAENITESTFSDNTITSLNRYCYLIEASNNDGIGGSATTGYIVNGPTRELPLLADFNDEDEAKLWSVGDANGDGVYFFWQLNSYENKGYYYYQSEYTDNADDWLISPITRFEKGKNYKAIVNARPANDMSIEKIEFYLVKDYNISSAIKIGETFDVIGKYNELTNDVDLQKYRVDFNNIEGEYSFAIRCVSLIDESYWVAIADVELAENHDGHIRGDVWDDEGNPVEDVLVQVDDTEFFTYTDSNGQFEIKNILQGEYTITCSKLGYKGETVDVTVVELETKTLELDIVKRKEFKLSGNVNNEYGSPLTGATINITGYNTYNTTTDVNGRFVVSGIFEAEEPYNVIISKPFYENCIEEVTINTNDIDLSLILNDDILQPAMAYASINDNDASTFIEWTKPALDTTIKKHSNDGFYTFGSEEGNENTLIGIVCDKAIIIDMLTWCLFEMHESINVTILALDENGNCTNHILYQDNDAENNAFNITTYYLDERIMAPNGCFIGLSCDEGYLSLLTTPATEEYPFIKKFNAYLEDFTNSTDLEFVEALGKDYEENFYLNVTGMLIADETAPSVSYNIYRINEANQASLVNTESINSLSYIDNSWANATIGSYKYAITAKYVNGKESEQTITQELNKTTSISPISNNPVSINLINNSLYFSEVARIVEISSIDGKQIISATNTSTISLDTLPCGIYLVNAIINNVKYTKKIFIK